jgi:hypothetical protein
MTDAAILATFADWRTVKGRKVLQLVFEVPLEDQAKVLSHLGPPMPMAEIWCGIARIEKEPVARKGKAGGAADGNDAAALGVTDPVKPPATKSPRKWPDMPPSSRAALWCKEPMAWAWLEATGEVAIHDELDAATELKTRLNITSRAEIVEGSRAAAELSHMIGNYNAWRQAKGHGLE